MRNNITSCARERHEDYGNFCEEGKSNLTEPRALVTKSALLCRR